jgi:hypothetical protein
MVGGRTVSGAFVLRTKRDGRQDGKMHMGAQGLRFIYVSGEIVWSFGERSPRDVS